MVRPDTLPLARPLMVWITATASSEIRWNGVLIGRNGQPGPDRASERPGRFIASFPVPAALVRPGPNLVSARLSAHHLWLPVRRTVHVFEVTPYETPSLPGLSDYLPALLTMGALAAAAIYFAAAGIGGSDRRARLLALIAGATMVQLVVEVVRAFIAYSYPWHLVRVAAIALLAGVTAILVAAYAAARFAPSWRRRAVPITAAAALASILFIPWYDLKAMGAILAGLGALGACAAHGIRRGQPKAPLALAASVVVIGLMVWQRTDFLDRAYYLGVAALLVALVAEQVAILRLARHHRDTETRRAAALEERLARAMASGEEIVELKDGARLHRIPESDIVRIRAADDYCDVYLADGRAILTTTTLARLMSGLPDRFLRVHKSHAVNLDRVVSTAPRDGGGRALTLGDGSVVPVGRSYNEAVAGWTKRRSGTRAGRES
jgi:DNA-binding LytR/AlgR family response regulator